MKKNYNPHKRIHMKRASIYTENDAHPKTDEDYLGIPSMTKGSSVALPTTLEEIPVYTKSSGAFLDFNKQFKNVRFKDHKNKFQKLSHYGNGAHGFFRHDGKNQLEEIEDLQFKKPHSIKFKVLDYVETIKEEQRTTSGAEIAGNENLLSHEKALGEMRRLMTKRNRGGRSGKDGGAYQGGHRYNVYNEEMVKSDTKFQKYLAEPDEFRSITEGGEMKENFKV